MPRLMIVRVWYGDVEKVKYRRGELGAMVNSLGMSFDAMSLPVSFDLPF